MLKLSASMCESISMNFIFYNYINLNMSRPLKLLGWAATVNWEGSAASQEAQYTPSSRRLNLIGSHPWLVTCKATAHIERMHTYGLNLKWLHCWWELLHYYLMLGKCTVHADDGVPISRDAVHFSFFSRSSLWTNRRVVYSRATK